jgi:hypothetical protein
LPISKTIPTFTDAILEDMSRFLVDALCYRPGDVETRRDANRDIYSLSVKSMCPFSNNRAATSDNLRATTRLETGCSILQEQINNVAEVPREARECGEDEQSLHPRGKSLGSESSCRRTPGWPILTLGLSRIGRKVPNRYTILQSRSSRPGQSVGSGRGKAGIPGDKAWPDMWSDSSIHACLCFTPG